MSGSSPSMDDPSAGVPQVESDEQRFLQRNHGYGDSQGAIPSLNATDEISGAAPILDGLSSGSPGIEWIELGFLQRGYGYGEVSGGIPSVNISARSTSEIWIGPASRGRLDYFNTPVPTDPAEGDDMILGATISSWSSGQTLYLGTFDDGTESRVSIPMPGGRAVQLNVRSSTAPGAGESFTYTVVKNGIDTSMTVTVSESDQEGTTADNQVTCSTGDRISLKVVTSAGAATAYHRYSLRYTIS